MPPSMISPAPTVLRTALLFCSVLLLYGCASILRNPVPEDAYQQVTVLGHTDFRVWGERLEGQPGSTFIPADPAALRRDFGGIMHREHAYLAISGGGADGAYGAGVLVGWTALGTRPEFTMVTGVSTGALTAPFAFLGPEYDDELKLLYTTLDSSSIFFRRSVFSILRGDAVADNTPLLRMLERYVTDAMIAEIAREYRRGRMLSVATTNLDAGRSVVWNIGRIANSGEPGAPQLIRQILLASAAIPGVFPPAYIKVQAPNGRTYDEMHVDGGTSTQMFLYPSRINFAELREVMDVRGTPRAYVIRNSRINPTYRPVRPWLPDIAGRSISSLIRTQGIGDAYRIAATTRRDGIALQLTWIPNNAPADPGNAFFDPVYMSALFEFGHQRVLDGRAWSEVDILNRRGPVAPQ